MIITTLLILGLLALVIGGVMWEVQGGRDVTARTEDGGRRTEVRGRLGEKTIHNKTI